MTAMATQLFFDHIWNERSKTLAVALATAAAVVLVLGMASTAEAASPDQDELSSAPISLVERFETPALPVSMPLDRHLELYHFHDDAPDGFELRFAMDRATTFYLSADLDAELPRLDSVDGDTYFKVGLELAVTPRLRVFVEDFMSATAVTGRDETGEDLLSDRAWDGHQVALGAIYALTPSLDVRGELRGYVLSETRRDEDLGGAVSLQWSY